jgi:polyferredoxin
MNRTDEEALAWALVESVTSFLKPAVCTWLCAKTVAGERISAALGGVPTQETLRRKFGGLGNTST